MSRHPCVFGEVLFDHFPDGHKVLGGAPFNVAWHLQGLGQSPRFISRVGDDDEGRLIRQTMRDRGMEDSALQTDASLPTGKVSVSFADGEPQYDIVRPCAWDNIEDTTPAPACRLLYHGSLALRTPGSAAALQQLLQQRPALVFVDVNLRDPWWHEDAVLGMVARADWVKLNEQELRLLAPPAADDELLPAFLEQHALSGAVLTRGEQGAVILTDDGQRCSVVPQRSSRIVDTVGAGDAFCSVIITGLMNAWPLQATIDRAQQFASAIVQQRGATVDDPMFYSDFRTRWELA